MSDEAIPQAIIPPPTEAVPTRPDMDEAQMKPVAISKEPENGQVADANANNVATNESTAPKSDIDNKDPAVTNNKQPTDTTQDKPATKEETTEMERDAAEHENIKADDAVAATSDNTAQGADALAPGANLKARRKSGGVPEHKAKKLNKKASKAKMTTTHIDAKPGDYFMVRLKGYPAWPAIICDESMLPTSLLKSRPVTAAGPDGTYRADYQDGGSKVKDRTFPVMYLYTNEFGWVSNTQLEDMDFDTLGDIPSTTRKDLQAAHQLAAEKHDLDFFKDVLKNFMEARAAELAAKEAAKEAARAAKEAAKAAKAAGQGKKQSKAKAATKKDGDAEMTDAPTNGDEAEAAGDKPKKTKKRKAEEDGVTDSAKKPKTVLKLTNTPKSTSTPKTPKDQSASKSKPKTKKSASKAKEAEVIAPEEPELTAEEKRANKHKEIMFLRHKLQKGLLNKEQEPKAEDMASMSDFVTKLEDYADLEVSIIRATKINKVLKAILKLVAIPKEEEYNFKTRSQALLDKWNKLLAVDQDAPATPTTNGVTEDAKPEETAATGSTNGVEADAKAAQESAPGATESDETKPPGIEPSAAEAST